MRALQLFGDRDVRLVELEPPPPPGPGEAQFRVRTVGLNHLDVWGFRGMAFAKRKLPLTGRPRPPARWWPWARG
jgi:NADPH:quinone reductase-like Zn-dependent oxidoreductase